MPTPMSEASDILQETGAAARVALETLEVFAELESTSTYLVHQARPADGRFRAVLANHQTAGRGRNEKIWHSPPGSGLCLSLAYTFAKMPRNLPSLTLAIGVAIAAALERLGVSGLALKWPNDLVVRDSKLGGILTEMPSDAASAKTVIIGIGLNVDLPNSMRYAAPTAWSNRVTDLVACMAEVPGRAELAGAIITSIIDVILQYVREGFAPFRDAWQEHDWLIGKRLSVRQVQRRITGTAEGIDEDGALLVKTSAGTERVVSGSIELPAFGAARA
jgi:BirA family transcriptional regulator, biotin operon repressor / biotin---[acetyl-CoA-carboxylase] ligase